MSLLDYALKRSASIHFWHSAEDIDTWFAKAILTRARAISIEIQKQGVSTGDCVALMLPTSVDLICGILAAWGCRASICIIPHSLGESSGKMDSLKMTHIFELIKPKLFIHDLDETSIFSELPTKKFHCREWQNLPDSENFPDKPQINDVAIIQLTSGSTAYPKGVILEHSQVDANIRAIVARLKTSQQDHTVSWLPFYHDMGLSSLLISLVGDFPLTLIQTKYFMRDASVWLRAITQQRATLTHAPAFAYALLSRQKSILKKYAIDLSSLRYASIGAEPLHSKHLDTFNAVMKPFGLLDCVLQPSYGLAESVVAVSFNSGEKPYRCLSVDIDELQKSGHVNIVDETQSNAISLVSNGLPLEGIFVSIRLENGELAKENQQGFIWISGDSLTKKYVGNVDHELFQEGWFNTGDLGFIYEHEIYISGRAKDAIIRSGVTISPAYVEFGIENFLNLKSGRVVIFSIQNFSKAREEIVVVIGLQIPKEEQSELIKKISIYIASEMGLQINRIQFVSPNQIPRTTSGKVQRNATKQLYLKQEIFES